VGCGREAERDGRSRDNGGCAALRRACARCLQKLHQDFLDFSKWTT
jgi:hypothetical protein